MNSFGWLHLSDLHQGMGGHKWLWPNVRENIYDDIARLHKISGPWDIIFFTGDMIQQGSREEFSEFEKTMSHLLEYLRDLGSEPVFVAVPGNHDLSRPNSKTPEAKLLNRWDEEPEVQSEFWLDPFSPYRSIINRSFINFSDWWDNSNLPHPPVLDKGPLPGDFSATIEKNNIRIGVLGLNSAFLQLTAGNYNGRLAVGLSQFQESCKSDGPTWAHSHDICFLMSHHPPHWLSSTAQKVLRGEIAPPGRFVAHLYGHMHDSRAESVSAGGAKPWRGMQSPALFGLEEYGTKKETRQHGFFSGRIKVEDDQWLMRIWPRLGVRRPEGYWSIVPDVMTFDLENDQGTRPELVKSKASKKRIKKTVKDPERNSETVIEIVKETKMPSSAIQSDNVSKSPYSKVYCSRCGINPGGPKTTCLGGYSAHNFVTSDTPVYCSRCGIKPNGPKTTCLGGSSAHDFVPESGVVYCSRCGHRPGDPKTTCLGGYSTHNFVEYTGSVFCSRCGTTPDGPKTTCAGGYSAHNFVKII